MRQFIGSTLLAIVALLLALYEWDAGRGARAGMAVVVDTTVAYRSGQTSARDVPSLPIDAAPPLWDRELDG
jgi:hypothetical protein